MVEYTCINCKKVFRHKGTYDRHLNRKRKCVEQKILDKKEEVEPEKEIVRPSTLKPHIVKVKEEYFECIYCFSVFSSRSSRNRHIRENCLEKRNLDIDSSNKIKELEKKIEELSKKNGSTININNNSNIQLNPFGKENIDYIKDEYIKNAIKVPQFGLPNLIRLIHFNKDHPENMNIKQRNKKKPMVDIYNGKEWVTMDKHDTIHSMVSSKKELMDEYFNTFPELEDNYKNNYERFSHSVDAYLNSQLPKVNCFEEENVTNKCKELYKSFIFKIDVLLMNR